MSKKIIVTGGQGRFAKELKKLKTIDAHKAIYFALKEEMQEKIHALEIEIE